MGAGGSSSAAAAGEALDTAPVGNLLLKFFQMLGGNKWHRKDGWDREDEMLFGEPDWGEYIGIGVNPYDDVIRISLPRNNLNGLLPFSQKWPNVMVELRTVDLEDNRILGEFPATWCQLANLTDLNLTKNGLRGTFPDAIGNLVTLKKLKLGMNHFHGKLPLTMSKLTDLTRLELHRNRLEGSPEMLGNLVQLHTLKLNENQFTGEIPDSWILLEGIKEIYMFTNHFSLFTEKSTKTDKTLTPHNIAILDVLRKRCSILVMLDEQVGDGGFVADRLPSKDIWPHQPHLYGNGFTSVKLPSHDPETLATLASIRNEERDVATY